MLRQVPLLVRPTLFPWYHFHLTRHHNLGFNAKASVSHPGPVNFYMAKAPAGVSVTNWDGNGKVWFKIYSDGPTVTSGGLTWPTTGLCFSGRKSMQVRVDKKLI